MTGTMEWVLESFLSPRAPAYSRDYASVVSRAELLGPFQQTEEALDDDFRAGSAIVGIEP